jgi:hypothetical protein
VHPDDALILTIAALPLEQLAALWSAEDATRTLTLYNAGVRLQINLPFDGGRILRVPLERRDAPFENVTANEAPALLAALVKVATLRLLGAPAPTPAPAPAVPAPHDDAPGRAFDDVAPALAAAISERGGAIDRAVFDRMPLKAHANLKALFATRWAAPWLHGRVGERRVERLAFEFDQTTFDIGLGLRLATSDDRAFGYVVRGTDLAFSGPPVYWYDFRAASGSLDPSAAPQGPAAPSLLAFLSALSPDPG